MKRYTSTLWVNTDQSISARIIISYYSQTREKSRRYYDSVMIRVGGSVVQISRLPAVELHHTHYAVPHNSSKEHDHYHK